MSRARLAETQVTPDTEPVAECPACGSPDRTLVTISRDWTYLLPGEFPLMRCSGCAAVYPDPRPTQATLPTYYPSDDYYAYSERGRHVLFARTELPARLWYLLVRGLLSRDYGYPLGGLRAAAVILRAIPPLRERATHRLGVLLQPWRPNGAVLDVGCGAGSYLDLMRALGWSRTAGVDISASAIESARALGLEAYVGELADAGFSDGEFDAVSMSHTLEHVSDPVGLLREVRRVTKPGGRIAIVVPNVQSLSSRIFGERWVGLETPRHLVNYSKDALAQVLADAGLVVESIAMRTHGVRRTALFSLSRYRGDAHAVYSDDRHHFTISRHATAAAIAAVEVALCALGRPAGELLVAVARA
jgi:SAM-dependent methyltransferase